MLIGRISGKPIIAYESMDDAIVKKSCLACIRYNSRLPCPMYRVCRAEKKSDEQPVMFYEAGKEVIWDRMTPTTRSDIDGLEFCCT